MMFIDDNGYIEYNIKDHSIIDIWITERRNMDEIKLIKDIVASPNADTLSNRLMNAKVELNATRNFLNDAGNFRTDDYDMGLSCEVILSKYIEYLQYKVKMLEKMHTKLQNNKYIKRDELPEELTTIPKKKKPNTKKEVSCSIPYTSSDNADMLLL